MPAVDDGHLANFDQPGPARDWAVLFVLIATTALAFKGVFAKFAYSHDLSINGLLMVRFGLAVPLFALGAVYFAKSKRTARQLAMTRRDWREGLLGGALFFAATYCDFMALLMIDAGISRVILFTFPGMVLLINAARARQWPGWRLSATFVVTYAGLVLVMAPDGLETLHGDQVQGYGWALGSALSYAIYLVASQGITRRMGTARFMAVSSAMTLAMLAALVPFTGGYGALNLSSGGVMWAVVIAVFCTVIPFFLLFEAIRRAGATQAAMVTLLGPVITVGAAWSMLGETLVPLQMAGVAIVLLGVGSLKSRSKGGEKVPEVSQQST